MAKSIIPDAIERRHLIDRDLKPAQSLRYAEAYLEVGRDQDAIEFLVKAEATEQLQAMRNRAIESGDVFLFRSVSSALGVVSERDEWRSIAETARAAGRQRYADEAMGMAERGED
jgi:hypothetical protein